MINARAAGSRLHRDGGRDGRIWSRFDLRRDRDSVLSAAGRRIPSIGRARGAAGKGPTRRQCGSLALSPNQQILVFPAASDRQAWWWRRGGNEWMSRWINLARAETSVIPLWTPRACAARPDSALNTTVAMLRTQRNAPVMGIGRFWDPQATVGSRCRAQLHSHPQLPQGSGGSRHRNGRPPVGPPTDNGRGVGRSGPEHAPPTSPRKKMLASSVSSPLIHFRKAGNRARHSLTTVLIRRLGPLHSYGALRRQAVAGDDQRAHTTNYGCSSRHGRPKARFALIPPASIILLELARLADGGSVGSRPGVRGHAAPVSGMLAPARITRASSVSPVGSHPPFSPVPARGLSTH